MGGESVRPGEEILDRAGIPTFAYPDTAARLFTLMWRSHYNLQALYETPDPAGRRRDAAGPREAAGAIVDAARAEGRTVLTEVESKQLLAAYGIPTVETRVAADRGRGRRRRRGDRLSRSSSSCTRTRSPTRPTSAACSSTWRMPTPSAARSESIEESVRDRAGAGALRRRQRAADGQARRLRADRRQQPGSAVRPGAPLRHRRPARRGLPRPRAGPAAAQHDAGPPDDGADPDLHRAQGRARPTAGGPGGARAAPGPVQRPGRRAAMDQGDRHQPAAGLARSAAGPGRAGDRPRAGRDGVGAAAAGDPALSDASTSRPGRPRTARRCCSGRSAPRTSRCWSRSTARSRSGPCRSATSTR